MPADSPQNSSSEEDSPQLQETRMPVEDPETPATSYTTATTSKKNKNANDLHVPQEILDMEVTNPKQLLKYINAFYETVGDNITTGSYVAVKNLNYSIPVKKGGDNGMKPILKDLSFYIRPGMMILVLGNPGGGRSSLLKVLADVLPKGGQVEGQILYNNRPIDPLTHHRDVGYVTQGDAHIPTLTVRETLEFSSACIVPPELSDPAISKKRLDILLSILGLEKCQDTLVGDEFVRGISGGQKKRVTIGVDLCKGAQLLLMDEPTTGLDSVTTLKIMGSVKTFTATGRMAVMCALLQPPREVFELFDHVLLLDDGEISFFGKREEAAPYFNSMGYFAPEDMNPAEFLQEVVVHPEKFIRGEAESQLNSPADFAEAFKQTEQFEAITRIVSDPAELIPSDVTPTDSFGKPTYINSTMRQFQLNMWRSALITIRNKTALIARAMKVVLLALIIGTVYLNIGNSQSSSSQRRSVLFFSIFEIMFASLITIRDLYDQRPIFYEQRDLRKWYTTLPYFIAYIIPELVIGFLEVVLFSVILYWLVDLQGGSARFIYFVLILYGVELTASSTLLFICAVTPTSVFAGTILPSVDLFFALCSGFLIPAPIIPGWWIWMYWASPLKWVFEGLMINEYYGLTFGCKPDELVPKLSVAQELFNGNQVCPITTGISVIQNQGFNTHFWWRWIDLAVVFGYSVLFLLLSFLALRFYDQSPRGGSGLHISKKLVQKDREASELREKQMEDATAVEMQHEPHEQLKVYGAYLSFQNVNYYVKATKKKEEKPAADSDKAAPKSNKAAADVAGNNELQLLRNISGFVKPGCLLALMGASGAGKSTLLDVLANRKSSGRITGSILINGEERLENFTRYAAYVTQSDVLFVTFTVKEAIRFSALNRLPEEVPYEEKMQFVEQILDDLELRPICSRVIGSGLSVEQKKRLNLAVELASNPQLIFLDEPTSGLDSVGARIVMNVVKKLSMQGRSIICTIHQPSAEIFQLFDSLLLLASGGDVVYFGDLGEKGSKVMEFANTHGYYMQEKRNIADFVLEFSEAYDRSDDDTATEMTETISGESAQKGLPPKEERNPRVETKGELIEIYRNSSIHEATLEELASPEFVPSDFAPPELPEKYATSFGTQLRLNLSRSFLSLYSRRRNAILFQLIRMFFFGIFMGTIFIHFKLDQLYITERVAWIFFSSLFGGFIGFAFIPMMFQERSVFYHEQASGTYRPTVYGISLMTSFLPLLIGASIVYMFPAYWIPTFDPSHNFPRFLFFLLVQFLVTLVLVGVAAFLAVATPMEGIAVMLAGVIYPVLLLFAGFFIPRTQIPGWWIWMYWISWVHYAVEPMALEIFKSLTYTCTPSQLIHIPLGNGQFGTYCPLTTYEQIVQQFGLLPVWKWIDVGILAASFFGFAALICLMLAKVRWEKT